MILPKRGVGFNAFFYISKCHKPRIFNTVVPKIAVFHVLLLTLYCWKIVNSAPLLVVRSWQLFSERFVALGARLEIQHSTSRKCPTPRKHSIFAFMSTAVPRQPWLDPLRPNRSRASKMKRRSSKRELAQLASQPWSQVSVSFHDNCWIQWEWPLETLIACNRIESTQSARHLEMRLWISPKGNLLPRITTRNYKLEQLMYYSSNNLKWRPGLSETWQWSLEESDRDLTEQ
jgi:hypothetical protein